MRTLITTFILALSLPLVWSAGAQSPKSQMKSASDSVLLSQWRDGDYEVRKYLVKRKGGDSDFSVRYRINLSTLSPNLDDNNKELAELKLFMDSLRDDSTIRVSKVEITGYASPDGNEASNKKLAYARAETLKNYLESKYGVSGKYNVAMDGIVEEWNACDKALSSSNVSGKEKALAVIRGKEPRADKERSLRSMGAVWSYLKTSVLPKMRYADVEFAYNRDRIVETRTLIKKPKVVAVPVANDKCCCCGAVVTENLTFVEDLTNGLIVEMDEVDVDW